MSNTMKYNVVKSVTQKKTTPLIKMGNDFLKDFFTDDDGNFVPMRITSMRIIFLIYNTFSSSNDADLYLFQSKEEPRQLKLFEDNFLTEHNQYIRITLKNSAIVADQNRDLLEDAIEYLTKYRQGWHTSYNSAGKKIRSYGGLITAPTYEEKGHTSFLISSFWLKQIIAINSYNYFLLQTAWKLRSVKDIFFIMYLSILNEKGTTVSFKTLNKRFDLDYISAKTICDQFLRPMRSRIDKYSRISFNFSRKGSNIIIVPYGNNVSNLLNELNDETKEKLENLYKLSYYKKRHELQGIEFEKFKIVFNQKQTDNRKTIHSAYELLKKKKKENKERLADVKGSAFFKILQECIIENYQKHPMWNSNPKGYLPII